MPRKTIFDIIKDNTNLSSDISRISVLFRETDTVTQSGIDWTIYDFINDVLFDSWKQRNHCINLDDFLETINYDEFECYAPYNQNSLILFIETIYNFWTLTERAIQSNKYGLQGFDTFYLLKKIMDETLSQMNYRAYEVPEEQCVLIEEDKPEVTSVAEIIEQSLVFPVLRYNHISLKGDINAKKNILLALGSDLEGKRPRLESVNKRLSRDIFSLLNNLNLRHNNIDPATPAKYRKQVAEMNQATLETWYDELYQMILLAYLLLDHEAREEKIAQLGF